MAANGEDRVLIEAQKRTGRTFSNEGAFLAALASGKRVFTMRGMMFWEVVADGDGVKYIALTKRPEDL